MVVTSNLFVKQKGTSTALKQPKELTFYSRTDDDKFLVEDDVHLQYYYLPDGDLERRLDLSGGIKKIKDTASNFKDQGTLSGLLQSIQSYEQRKNKKVKADIITFRGIMRKLISAAFDTPNFNPIDLRIVSFDGQLFIKEVPKEEGKPAPGSPAQLAWYSGYKFETLATLPQPLPLVSRTTLDKRPKKLVNTGEEYITVVKTGVSNVKIVLGAEVDCIFDFKEEGKDNLKHYAELKCTTDVTTAADARKFERKVFRTWLQCFLVGIPRIIYGFRDNNNLLKTVEEYTTTEVPILLKSNNPTMNSSCLDAVKWYGTLTEWLLKMVPRDGDSIRAYRLVYENNHLRLTEIEDTEPEYKGLVEGEEVLTDEFKEWRKSMNQGNL
ncbi:protein rai1 [Zygosaccharomyces mellis]|uniref:Decapping nuclease n=1 Tax=Zygosaccharomyces mellis TaxID=42258 RepID=A0A4C2EAE7_9SACH|nr:protein rai1 [Zygosaccharomyces mellis]